MKKQIGIAALLLIPAGVALATSSQAVQEKKAVSAVAPKDDPAMMKMKEFATPGPELKVLGSMVGKWTGKQKCWMEPGGAPQESTCTSEFKWILGERFLQDSTKGEVMGAPFEGMGTTAFDKFKKKYVMTWIDSLSTAITVFEGTYDQATKTFTYTGQCADAVQGKYVAMRIVDKVIDADHSNMQMFSTGPDGKEFKTMEIEYARAK